MRRLFVVDDEEQIRRLLEIAFSARDWEVLSAPSGFEGLQGIQSAKPDVVLLDLNLPDMSGLEVLESLRAWSPVPVIVVSVRNSESDIVALLNAGADDYITKPFHTNELLARAEAAHRRHMRGLEPLFRSGRLLFDAGRRRVEAGGAEVRLTTTEHSVLEVLVRNAGRIVTRERLLREVWGPSWESEEGNLRVYINALRKKLEREPSRPALIVTETGVGYRLRVLPPEPCPGGAGSGIVS